MGLAGGVRITGQQRGEQDGGGSSCRDFANRLQLDSGASGASSITGPRLFGATVWPGPTQPGAKADGALGADRLGVKRRQAGRQAVMWLKHVDKPWLVPSALVRLTWWGSVVQDSRLFVLVYWVITEQEWVACRDYLHKPVITPRPEALNHIFFYLNAPRKAYFEIFILR